MSEEFSNLELDLDSVDEAGGFEPAPVGTHLCRLTVEDLAAIGNGGSLGFKVKGKVVEPNFAGRIAEDVLWVSAAALPRLKLALHRIAGINGGKLAPPQISAALNGKLARLTVESIEETVKGEKTYRHAKLGYAGYESATAEEVKKYGEPAAGAKAEKEKLPF